MPYLITDFEGVPLPAAMTKDDLGTGTADPVLLDSVGGIFDYPGVARRLPRLQRFSHSGLYEAGGADDLWRVTPSGSVRVTTTGHVRMIADSPLRWLQAQTDAIRAMVGVRGKLWRTRLPDGVRTWKLCRLMSVRNTAEVEDANQVAEIETSWETADIGWRSATPVSVQGSGAIIGLAVRNPGSIPIADAVLTITGTSGTITRIDIIATWGVALRWTGTLGTGQSLVIDCGAQTVRRSSVSAYSGFAILAGHNVEGWLPLRPGMSALSITCAGGNAAATLEHYPQWP